MKVIKFQEDYDFESRIAAAAYAAEDGRRYLIVMDDIWSVEAWDIIKSFFPDNNENEDKSWDLLCKIVFGKLDCPIDLENFGNVIARKCRGLPLSIAVIGGLPKKSDMTRAY
ncbi:hypothetical protein ACS0TY_004756 [Phlomoides rotata]